MGINFATIPILTLNFIYLGLKEAGWTGVEDVEGQEILPVSAGFELTKQGMLVQEHSYSATHPYVDTIIYSDMDQ